MLLDIGSNIQLLMISIIYDGPYSITEKGLILGQTDIIHNYYMYGNQIRFLNNGSVYAIKLKKDTFVIKDNIMIITNFFCKKDVYFGMLMNNVTTLIFDEISSFGSPCFNEPFVLTPSIVVLTFGEFFNQPIHLTRRITTLKFGTNFNKLIVLPSSMMSLRFGLYYNQPIILTPYITTLEFETSFDHPIVLGPHLRILSFGDKFNQPILLNKCLYEITFGYYFN